MSTGRKRQRSWWERALGTELRPGETTLVLLLSAYAGVLFACFYAAKTFRQLYFVDVLGAERLPYAYLLAALAAVPVLELYGRLVDRVARHWLLVVTTTLMALGMTVFALILDAGPWVPMALYVWLGLSFGIAVSQLWSYANQLFDPRQARRLFSLIAIGCGLGGVMGGQLTGFLISSLGTATTLPLIAVMHLPLIALVLLCERAAPEATHSPRGDRPVTSAPVGGLRVILRSPYLRLVALATFLAIAAAQLIDLQFSWAIQELTDDSARRAEVFGHLYSLISLVSLMIQIGLTARIHQRLGVGFAMKILPSSVVIGTVGTLLFIASPIAFATSAMALKIGEGGVRHSIEQVTRELLFMPVSWEIRQKAKTYIDVFVQRFGKAAAAVLLLSISLGSFRPEDVVWPTLAIGVLWLAITIYAYRHYVIAYREGLEAGIIKPDQRLDLHDVPALEQLIRSLGAGRADKVIYAIELLRAGGKADLVPPILIRHDHAEVRRATLEALGEADRNDAVPQIARAFSDDDADVRAEAVRTVARLRGEQATGLLLPHLRAPDPRVRAAVIPYMIEQGEEAHVRLAEAALEDLLADEDKRARVEAAKAIGALREPGIQADLIHLLYDRERKVVAAAVRAVGQRAARGANPVYVPILISLSRDRYLKHACRQALVAIGAPVIPALFHFMNDPREHIWVRRAAPKTIAQIGGPEAVDALLDTLGDKDPFLHRKLVESLVRLRDLGVDMRGHAEKIMPHIRAEAAAYLQYLADLYTIDMADTGRLVGPVVVWEETPTLLQQLLGERMGACLTDLFGLLATLYPVEEIRGSLDGLSSRKDARRGHALEFLDNALEGRVHRWVMAVISDLPTRDKLRLADKLFSIVVRSEVDTVRRIARAEAGVGTPALTVAAIYNIYERRLEALYPLVCEIHARTEDAFVRETAEWVARRIDHPVPEEERA